MLKLVSRDQAPAGLSTVLLGYDATLFHFIHQAAGAGIADAQPPLKHAGGGLPILHRHLNGLLQETVIAACFILGGNIVRG